MNLRLSLLCLPLLLAPFCVAAVGATEAPANEPGLLVDCARPSLPSQRDVGEMTGQHNFTQVYATRARLMAEAHRACRHTEAC